MTGTQKRQFQETLNRLIEERGLISLQEFRDEMERLFPDAYVYTNEDNWDDYFERVSESFKVVVSNFIENLGEDSENI